MKKFLAVLLAVALAASLSTIAVTAFTADYPASVNVDKIAAPTDGAIMVGEIIGAEGGWGDNPDVGRVSVFDGYMDTFYDPHANIGQDDTWVGIKMPETYVLTEIRILPRDGFLGRFGSAAIWGFNGDAFDPATATLIWERGGDPADEFAFQIIKPSEFKTNPGFTSYAYFAYEIYGDNNHGDVCEVEFYGKTAAAAPAATETPAAAEAAPAEATPEAAAVAPEAAPVTPAPAQTAPTTAPRTSDMSIVISLAVLVATAFVTVKLTRAKNRA